MNNSQYQMLHISINQNNFLNTNLSTLCVQKVDLICVHVCVDVVSGQNASLIDKLKILPQSKLILNTLLFFIIAYKLGFAHFNI